MSINKNNYKSNVVFNICTTAILIALSVLFKFISSQIRIFGDYGLDLEYVILVIGLILLPSIKYRLLLMFITPCLWITVSPIYVINPVQVFVEYFLIVYVYLPFLFINLNLQDNVIKRYILIPFALIICTLIKLAIHIIAGGIWWTNGNWYFSFILNSKIVITNLAINLVLLISLLKPCLIIKSLYYDKKSKVIIDKPIFI